MSAGDQWGAPGGAGGYGTPRSGANTAVAVLDFVLGGLSLICGVLAFIGAGAAASMAGELRGMPSGGLMGFLIAIAFIQAILYLLVGGGGIAAGVGVINRRSWGRVLTLVLAGICIVLGLLNLLAVFAGMILSLIGVLIFLGYAITCFVVLMNPVNAREFS